MTCQKVADSGVLTTSVDYEFGSEQFQSTTTGPAERYSTQLFLNEAYAPIAVLQSVSLLYLFKTGFTDPTIGNRKKSTTEEGIQITEITEKRTYADSSTSSPKRRLTTKSARRAVSTTRRVVSPPTRLHTSTRINSNSNVRNEFEVTSQVVQHRFLSLFARGPDMETLE